MANAYVALGSNLQDPIRQIHNALAALQAIPETRLMRASSLYKTAPIGYDASNLHQIPDFINAVVWLETTLMPEALLAQLFDIENMAGRERPYRFAPRVLDCDLLLYDDVVMHTETLTLPHPRMHLRGFVLVPLFELNPNLHIAQHGKLADIMQQQDFGDVVLLNATQYTNEQLNDADNPIHQ